MDMSFADPETKRALLDSAAQIASATPASPSLLTQLAGRALAAALREEPPAPEDRVVVSPSLLAQFVGPHLAQTLALERLAAGKRLAQNLQDWGGVSAVLALLAPFAQYVVPHLDARPLMEYLFRVEGGLPGCLVPRRHRTFGQRDPYFPSEACRQLLLKSVSERCSALPVVCGWRTDLLLENRVRNHHLAANYTNLLAAKDYQKELYSFQQELQRVFATLRPLNLEDLLRVQDLLLFFHQNGLTGQTELSLEGVLTQLFASAAAVVDHLSPPDNDSYEECVKWSFFLAEWLADGSVDWPNRRQCTSLVTFLLYSNVKSGVVQPLNGMVSQPPSARLSAALRHAGLDPTALYAAPEQEQFRPPRYCYVDLKGQRQGQAMKIIWLAKYDATAYSVLDHPNNPWANCTRDNVVLLANYLSLPMPPLVGQDSTSEAKFFFRLAEAESAYRADRFHDTLTCLAEVLCNYPSFLSSPTDFADPLSPGRVMPEAYLLLAKTLAQLHASDWTLLACFEQARSLLDAQRARGENDVLSYLLDDQFALAILVTLNQGGFLEQSVAFFQHVMEENSVGMLKQSRALHELCVEYVQNTALAWLENKLAWLVGLNQFHKDCDHTLLQLQRQDLCRTNSLLQRMANVVTEVRDLLAQNRRHLLSGQTSSRPGDSEWGPDGLAGQLTTLQCLQHKADFYGWLVRYVGQRRHLAADNNTYREELTLLMELYQSWEQVVHWSHPLYMETAAISMALLCIWESCLDPEQNPQHRMQHTGARPQQVTHQLSVIEAASGLRFSQVHGNACFKLYVWLSVGCAYSGNGRCKDYNNSLLRVAGLSLLKSSRGHSYRVPLISLLLNHLGWCSGGGSDHGSGRSFPSDDASKPCTCTRDPAQSPPLQTHQQNHASEVRTLIDHGFRALGNFPLGPLVATRKTRPTAGRPAPDSHDAFWARLLRGPDGPLVARALQYSTHGSLRAWGKGHADCISLRRSSVSP